MRRLGAGPATFVGLTAIALLLALAGTASAADGCTKTWNASANDASWATPANWTPNGVPQTDDKACISGQTTVQVASGSQQVAAVESDGTVELSGGSLTVTDAASASQVRRLVLAGGSLGGAGTLHVTDSFSWTSGSMVGTGQTVIDAGATGSIALASESSTVWLEQRALVNRGTMALARGQLYGRDGDSIDNQGTFRLNAESWYGIDHYSGAASTFKNTGTVEKTTGTGRSRIGFRFDNRGSVRANSGELSVGGGAVAPDSEGSWTGAADGSITFDGAGSTFDVGRWQLAGNIKFEWITVKASVVTAPNADITIADNGSLTVTDAASASQVRRLVLAGGSLGGAGTLHVTDSFSWTSGSMVGTGQTVIDAGATGSIALASESSTVSLIQRRLVNRATMVLSRGGIYGAEGSSIDNAGTFVVRDSSQLSHWFGAKPALINRGELVKTGSTGTAQVSFDLGNAGSIREESGKFNFTGNKVDVNAPPTAAEQRGPGNAAMPNYQRSCAGKPVDCATGNQFEVQTDLSVGGRGVGLGLARTYNSQAAASQTVSGAFGYGWRSSFSDRLDVDAGARRATVRHADGSSVSFLIAGDETFVAPPRVQASLTRSGDGTYVYVLPDQRRLVFSAAGRLERVADENQNATTFAYDADRLVSITDPAGRSINLAYDSAGHVVSATDPTGLKVVYGYSSGSLVSVTYEGKPAAQWRFGYDAKHQLTSMTDARGGTTTTAYDADGRAVVQTDALQRSRRWEYRADERECQRVCVGMIEQEHHVHEEPHVEQQDR